MRLGILTGGGDCPGLNAAVRAVVRSGVDRGVTILGFRDGWRGVMEGEAVPLAPEDVRGILPKGGTILGTSGTQPSGIDGGPELVRRTIAAHDLDGFAVIGGEGTMGRRQPCPTYRWSVSPRPSTTTSAARTQASDSGPPHR